MNDAVAVIITCHNLEKYISAAIDSVKTQDFPGPVEIVVVDDLSSDASPSIIQGIEGLHIFEPQRILGC